MLTVADYYNAIDRIAPFSLAESWDNVGLLVGSGQDSVQNVLLALDVTSKVIEEAEKKNANLIITHHPAIFSPMSKINSDSLVYRLVQKGIAVISAHTNLDIAKGGVNDTLAKVIGLKDIEALEITNDEPYYKVTVFTPTDSTEAVYNAMVSAGAGRYSNYSGAGFISEGKGRFAPELGSNPTIGKIGKLEEIEESRLEMIASPENLSSVIDAIISSHPYEEPAYDIVKTYALHEKNSLGRIGNLDKPMSCQKFATHISKVLNAVGVRYNNTENNITRVALCGGSGDFTDTAITKGADAYVIGETKHSTLLKAAEKGLCVVNAGHFATENVVMAPLKNKLEKMIPNGEFYLSELCTDGVLSV